MPGTLVEVLADDARRRAVARDGATIVDQEVAARTGLRAAALKAGYATVKALRPGIIEEALYALLPGFAPAVDPHWAAAVATGDAPRYFRERAGEVASSLLAVTDARAARAKNPVMKRVYGALRGQALAQTTQSVPRLPELIARHVR
jgi:hypothetical protein